MAVAVLATPLAASAGRGAAAAGEARLLGDHVTDDVAVDVRQSHVAATKAVGEFCVVDAQQVQHRGVQIVHRALFSTTR